MTPVRAPVDQATRAQLKLAYQALLEVELAWDDPRYVELFEDPALASVNPAVRMAECIQFSSSESVQLFSGHRGTGKSTQLRQLKHRLELDPTYKVVICDMEKYLPMTDEIEVVDFLLGAAGALSEALAIPELLGADPTHAYWGRFVSWLRGQRIDVEELGLGAKAPVAPEVEVGANIKVSLKYDADFRTQVRERMRLHVGAFRTEVHDFAQDCLKRLRKRFGEDTQLVVIFDSIEHLRGTTLNPKEVAHSVEQLFRGHAEALRFPYVHTVFTVPPWLRLQYAGIASDKFDNYCWIPCVKVRTQPPELGGEVLAQPGRAAEVGATVPNQAGLDGLWRVADKRGDMLWLLGDRAAFDELALVSGGYLRGLLRLLADLALDAGSRGVPVAADRRRLAIDELRNAYVGFSNREAVWLQAIEATGKLDIDDSVDPYTVARFLDTHVLLGYRNGRDWYGVHPVIREEVARRAAAWQAAQAKAEP